MTTTSSALRTTLDYHQAWTGGDLDKTMTYIADDITCDAPTGRIEGAAAYREFTARFIPMVIRSTVTAAFGDDDTAMIMYDTETPVVEHFLAADHTTVKDGKITYIRTVFDRSPFIVSVGEQGS